MFIKIAVVIMFLSYGTFMVYNIRTYENTQRGLNNE